MNVDIFTKALAARAHDAGDAEHAVVAGLRMHAKRHAERLSAVINRIEHAVAHIIETVHVGRKHRRHRAGLLEVLELLHRRRWILTGNQADGEQALEISGAVFHEPLVDCVAKHGRQFLVHQAVDRERDLGAEEDRHVDTFFVHVFKPRDGVDHAGSIAARFFRHRAGNSGAKPLRRGPETSFEQHSRIAFIVLQSDRCLRPPFLRHTGSQVDVTFINMSVGIDNQHMIKIFH